MKSLDELTNLMNFLETQLSDDHGIMSSETIDELKYVLETYAAFEDNADLASILKRMEAIDSENQTLKSQLEKLKTELKEKAENTEHLRKTVITNEAALQKVSSTTEDKIIQLTDEVCILTKDKNVLLKELEDEREKARTTELKLKESEERYRELNEKFYEVTTKYDKLSSLNKENDTILKDRLELTNKEFETLKSQKSKFQRGFDKIQKFNHMYKHNHKSQEQIIKNLQREKHELQEANKTITDKVGTDHKKSEELITKLIIEIQKGDYNQDRLNELLDTFGKRQILVRDIPPVNDISMVKMENGGNYGNLEDYEDIFNDSVAVGADHHQDNQNMSLQFENNDDLPMVDSRRNIHFVQAMQNQGMDALLDGELIGNRTIKNEPDPKKFMSMQDDIKQQLEKMIGEKTLFKTQRPEKVEFNNSSVVFEKKEDIIKDLKGLRTPVDINSTIKIEEVEKLIEFLEEYLSSEKNPTAFTLTSYDKKQFTKKFTKSPDHNIKRYYTILSKLFVYHINFLEGHIKNLMNSNSHLLSKVDSLKNEMHVLLKNYLEKNKKAQDFMNSASEFKISKLIKSKVTEMKPVESVVLTKERPENELQHSNSKSRESPKKSNNPSGKDQKSGKQTERKRKRDGKTAEKSKISNDIEKSKDENIWSKFTSILPFNN